MGWTFYNARNYLPNGKVDKKAECRELFKNGYTVLKDSIVGNTWYAAVREEKSGDVFAAVVLTEDGDKDYNFGYKDMDETVGPIECDCPKSILRELGETDSLLANDWRIRCWKKIEKKETKEKYRGLPVYTRIRINYNGKETEVVKLPPVEGVCYRNGKPFKHPWYFVPATKTYLHKKDLPNDFEVIGTIRED